jgi:hypothetical protein
VYVIGDESTAMLRLIEVVWRVLHDLEDNGRC